MLAQELRVAGRQLDGFRQQQTLRRRVALLQAAEHLLVENPFVRRVLVHQHQAAVGFEHDVEPANHADQTQRHLEQRHDGAGNGRSRRMRNADRGPRNVAGWLPLANGRWRSGGSVGCVCWRGRRPVRDWSGWRRQKLRQVFCRWYGNGRFNRVARLNRRDSRRHRTLNFQL